MVRKLKITKEITLDVSRLNRFQSIIAKQNDKDSRYLKVSVADEGNVLIIPSSAKVTITATRPDKLSSSFLGKISEDGKAIVPLSPWMLELDGSLSCDVSIITEESVLKTTSFFVDVEPDEASGNTDVTQDPNYDILVELIQEVAGVAAVEKEAISIAVDAYLHEKNIRPLQKGVDYWTDEDKAEITAQVQAVCVAKNQGSANVGKILVVGTDGNITLVDMPEGGASGDVTGVLDESNNILLSGNLADGTYTLKYENTDGTYTEIGTLEVGEIEKPKTNFAGTLTVGRLSGSASGNISTDTASGRVTDFVSVQNDDIVSIEGYNYSPVGSTVYPALMAFDTSKTKIFNPKHIEGLDGEGYVVLEEKTDTGGIIKIVSNSVAYIRFAGIPLGAEEDVVVNIKRNGEWL